MNDSNHLSLTDRHAITPLPVPQKHCALCDAVIRSNDTVCRKHYGDMLAYRGQSWFEALVQIEREQYRNAQRLFRTQRKQKHAYVLTLPKPAKLLLCNFALIGATRKQQAKLRSWLLRFYKSLA